MSQNLTLTVAALMLITYSPAIVKSREAKPNVVIVMADDIGLGDASSYHQQRTSEEPVASTPNLNRLIAKTVDETARYDRTQDRHQFTVFMQEGGWCWFQDRRAILHNGHLIMGAVQGNGSGPALIGTYDVKKGVRLKNFVARDHFDHDDHNSPVFHARSDGSVLAVYARHGREKIHYYRISDPRDCTKWGEEMTFGHPGFLDGRDNATYMNLHELSNEGRLFNFYRGFEFNPCFVTSADGGKTWAGDTHFIKSELKGRHRPYARYAGNGVDTVHVSFTDAHPDQFGNNVYYAAFRDGSFFRADGSLIKVLNQGGPLRPSEAELVFKGSGLWAPAGRASAERSAWTSSMVIDSEGRPHIGYSLHLSNEDHRFRIASWDGRKWIDREVSHAGKCLYDDQTSYTGLITLDPMDPTYVIVSTDVDPATGNDDGGKHEIYRARVGLKDDVSAIHWEAITQNSPVRNIRPVIVRDRERRIVLWNRGEFISYTNYQLDTVGLVESIDGERNRP